MTQRKKRVLRIAAALLSAWFCLFPPLAARAKATVIRNLRIGSTPEYVRLVLESDRSLRPMPVLSQKYRSLVITLAANIADQAMDPAEAHNRDILKLQITRAPDSVTRIQADFSFTPRDVRTFTLSGPHRFIIDAYRPLTAPPSASASSKKKQPPEKVDRPTQQSAGGGKHPASVATQRSGHSTAKANEHPMASTGSVSEASGRGGIPQSLLAVLIGVTSTIIVLLFFRICFGNSRNPPPETSGLDLLPPGKDPEIKHIDSQIVERMDALASMKRDQAADRQLVCMTEIIRLSLQKSERLEQRLEALITALEKGKNKNEGD